MLAEAESGVEVEVGGSDVTAGISGVNARRVQALSIRQNRIPVMAGMDFMWVLQGEKQPYYSSCLALVREGTRYPSRLKRLWVGWQRVV